jgi:glycine betaine/proline transport system ATP-binding protein
MRISGDMTLETAARQMTGSNQTLAVVVDDSGKPIGSLDLHSIISAMVTPTSHETAENKAAA